MNIADELQKLQGLHRSGALSDEEFAAAKAAVLAKAATAATPPGEPALQEHLEEIKLQNELARLDREWEIERERHMIVGRHGHRMVPRRGASVMGGIVITFFGLFWTFVAASFVGGFDGGFGCFPLFGILFVIFGIAMSIHSFAKANQYEEAFQAYQRRRQDLLGGRSGST